MSRAKLFLVTLSIGWFSASALSAQATTQPDLASENAKLRDLVRRLEAQAKDLQQLEAQVKDLERQMGRLTPRYGEPYSLIPSPRPDTQPSPLPPFSQPYRYDLTPYRTPNAPSPNVPKHWIPQQFNGETFYIVPLSGPQAGDLIDDRAGYLRGSR